MNSDLPLDWDNLRCFLAVARAGSFTGAAAELGTSQPTVWRKVSSLEESLGMRLLKREARGVKLTTGGERILRIVELVEQQVALIRTLGRSELAPEGTIRLWTTDGIGGYWLPDRLGAFQIAYPNVTIETMCSSDPPPPGSIGSDILIVYERPTDLDMVVLCEGRMIFRPFASRGYLEVHGTPSRLSDLPRHRICDHTEYPDDGPWRLWREATSDSRVTYRTNSSMALGEATRRGMGISLQPVELRNEREPDLVMLELEGFQEPELVFWLISHRETKDIPRVRALIEHVKGTLFNRGAE